MFAGGPVPSLSNEVFTEYLNNVRSGKNETITNDNAGEVVADAETRAFKTASAYDQRQKDELMLNTMVRARQEQGVKGMPQQYTHQMRGYSTIQNPQQFGMGTILPFDSRAEREQNFAAIARSVNPQTFGVSRQVVQAVEASVPQAQKALAYKGSLYEGVPRDYTTNRLYIATQRHRENSVYALV